MRSSPTFVQILTGIYPLSPFLWTQLPLVSAVKYLVSDNYVKGVVISLDGGWHLRFDRYFNI